MIDIKVVDGLYIVRIDKAILVLTKAEFIHCLRRGKWWKRRQALAARLSHDSPAIMGEPPSVRPGGASN